MKFNPWTVMSYAHIKLRLDMLTKFLVQISRIPIMASITQTSPSNGGGAIVGHAPNFWLFTNRDGFDLTYPSTPSAPKVYPRLNLRTTTAPVTIAPAKTALVIIDMQNFSLSAAMGQPRGEGHAAKDVLLKYGIPAARQAGIQVLWLTWRIIDAGL
jgi:hypothetical protein